MSNESRLQLLLLIIGAALISPLFYLGDGGLLSELTFYILLVFGIIALGYETTRQSVTGLKPSFVLTTTGLLFIVTIPHGIFIDTEIYRNIWDGLIQGQGENPYQYIPMSEAWMGMRGHEVYDLLQHPQFYSASSPVEMVLHRFITWADPLIGLNGLIIVYKLISFMISLSIIWMVIKLSGNPAEVKAPILLLAWNPLLLLMISGQGSLENLAILGVLAIIYFWDHHQQEVLPMVWGVALHLSFIPWLFLPWLIRKVRWTYLLIAIGTWIVWWMPFFNLDIFTNYISGLLSYHLYPAASVSPGYLIAAFFGWIYSGSEQWFLSGVLVLVVFLMIFKSKQVHQLDIEHVIPSILVASLLLWAILPSYAAALLGLMISLSVLHERYYSWATLLSLTIVLQIIALRLDDWSWIMAAGSVILVGTAFTYSWKYHTVPEVKEANL